MSWWQNSVPQTDTCSLPVLTGSSLSVVPESYSSTRKPQKDLLDGCPMFVLAKPGHYVG